MRHPAGDALDGEHRGVNRQHDLQNAPVFFAQRSDFTGLVFAAVSQNIVPLRSGHLA